MTPVVCTSLACWPGLGHVEAASLAQQGVVEPLFGTLSVAHVQVVPQSAGVFDPALAEAFRTSWPQTIWRLHANVRVLPERRVVDLAGFDVHRDWFAQAARVHRALGASAYSAHPGERAQASMPRMLDHARHCADLFGCAVAVEGQYPLPGPEPHRLLVSTWAEYRSLLESDVPYAVDLSHLNILAHRSASRDTTLVAELLACERCLEVHVSANDGSGDWHRVCERMPWWWPLLSRINPSAVVFSEGNHRRRTLERKSDDNHRPPVAAER